MRMSLSKINLVVIGHKDYGKSTLIGRLLYYSKAFLEQKLQEIEAELIMESTLRKVLRVYEYRRNLIWNPQRYR